MQFLEFLLGMLIALFFTSHAFKLWFLKKDTSTHSEDGSDEDTDDDDEEEPEAPIEQVYFRTKHKGEVKDGWGLFFH